MRSTSRTLRPWSGRSSTRIASLAATEPSEMIRRYAPGRSASVKRRMKPISSIRTPSRQQGTRGSATSSSVVPTSQRSPTSAPFTSIPSVVRFSPNCATGKRTAELALPPPQIFGSHRRRWPCRRLTEAGLEYVSRRALALRPSRAREVRSGVDRIAAPPPPVARAHHHLEVQMRLAPMSVASRADGANHLAADETGVLRKPVAIRIQVGVVVDEMFALVGCIYREPTLAVPLQSEHTPIVSGQDRCSAWCGDVDGAVDTGSAARGSKVVGYSIWRHARDGHH